MMSNKNAQEPLMLGTVTGRLIDINSFNSNDIDITDIAVSLAQQRRYAGHSERPWSVGQHLIFCSMLADQGGADPTHIKAVFLHDIEEAYVQDIISPIKTSFKTPDYNTLCDTVNSVIYNHFGCSGYNNEYVKLIDRVAYVFEHKAFRPKAVYPINLDEEVMERFKWFHETLNLGIPEDLINLTDAQVADIVGETLTVMMAEKTLGQEVSSEIDIDDIEMAIKDGVVHE